jgi:hypothetical protein
MGIGRSRVGLESYALKSALMSCSVRLAIDLMRQHQARFEKSAVKSGSHHFSAR